MEFQDRMERKVSPEGVVFLDLKALLVPRVNLEPMD